jgi:hypothetical protein
MEPAPELPDAGGFVIFGAPPVASPAQMAEAFLPHPAMAAHFQCAGRRVRGEAGR